MNHSQQKEQITRKLNLLVNALLSSEMIKRHLMLKSIDYYSSHLERGLVTIFIREQDYAKYYKIIEKCVQLTNRNINPLIKRKLIELALFDIRYHKLNNRFICIHNHFEVCSTYDINNSCMILIGIRSAKKNICSYYIDKLSN